MRYAAVSIILLLCVLGCNDNQGDPRTAMLTSKTWGQPEVIHHPPMGVWSWVTCAEGHKYNFIADGKYQHINYCDSSPLTFTGEWKWTTVGTELTLDTYYKNILQSSESINILELTDELLHTKTVTGNGPEDYYEFIYHPR